MRRFSTIAAILLACTFPALAQYTNLLENGTNLTVNSAWTNDAVWVGQATPGNTLQVVSGGSVYSTNVFVGASSNATDNIVAVTGTGSWNIEDTLMIGSGTNNTVTVGAGGTLSAGKLVVDSNNSFNLNNGGTLAITADYDADAQTNVSWNSGGTLSVGGQLTKSNGLDGVDRTLVIDGGSWNLDGDLVVSGASNTLSIVSGGTVVNSNAYVGYAASDSNNTVSVSGDGSTWVNNGVLHIGSTNGSVGNAVTVSDGGAVVAGDLSVAEGNSFNLNSNGTLGVSGGINVSQQTNLTWNSGGHLAVGGNLSGMTNHLDGGRDLSLIGGTWNTGTTNLVVGDELDGSVLSVYNGGWVNVGSGTANDFSMGPDGGISVGGTNGAVLLVNSNSTVQTSGGLYVGGTNANLTGSVNITNGGLVEAHSLQIGNAGSSIDIGNGGTLSITGNFNADAQTNVSWNSGGTLSVGGLLTKSNGLDGVGHALVINGGLWDLGGDLVVSGASNTLSIVSGGAVVNSNAYVGYAASDSNNTVSVSGGGSAWINNGELFVGSTNGSVGNVVSVSDGGVVEASGLSIAAGNHFDLNDQGTLSITEAFNYDTQTGLNWKSGGTLSVDGALTKSNGLDGADRTLVIDGGSWDLGGDLTISGTNNTLSVFTGGTVTNNDAYVGTGTSSLSNTVKISGDDSMWVNDGVLHIGSTNGSVGNAVSVSANGLVEASGLFIAAGNHFDLNDQGTLSITGDFNYDTQTSLNWNGGGILSIGGKLTKSTGLDGIDRTLVIDDGGLWDLGGDLAVEGTNNTLSVIHGGAVTNNNGYVGAGTNSLNNTVEVSGAGSTWVNDGVLYIGSANGSVDNAVYVSDGGRVEAFDLDVVAGNSFNLNSGGTLAITEDFNVMQHPNLVWDAGGLLSVAGELSGLRTITQIVNGNTNTITRIDEGHDYELTGTNGLLQLGSSSLVVGYNSANSDLTITNGATVSSVDGFIGWGGNASSNTVTVAGNGASWSNTGGDLYVGAYWSGSTLVNTANGNSLTVKKDGWVNVGELQVNPTNFASGSMLVASTNGAQLVVGRGSVNVEGTLYLGQDTNTTATTTIRNGGTVSVGNLEIAPGSLLDLQSGGTFAIAGNFDRSKDGFEWGQGGTLSVGGILINMPVTGTTNHLSDGRKLTLDGGSWNLGGNDLIVGISGSGSALRIVSDGSVEVGGDAYIGSVDSSGNTVGVEGSGSDWIIAGDLVFGGSSNSANNRLIVSDSGWVDVGNDLTLNAGNTISMESAGSISVGGDMNVYSNSALLGSGSILFNTNNNTVLSFYGGGITLNTGIVFTAGAGTSNTVAVQRGALDVSEFVPAQYKNFGNLSLTDSSLTGVGVLDSFDRITMSGGVINPAGSDVGRLELGGNFSASGTVFRAQVFADSWDELVFTGTNAVDLSSMSAEVLVPMLPVSDVVTILRAGELANSFASVDVTDRFLLYSSALRVDDNEVQVVITPNDESVSAALDLSATESVRAGFSGMKNMVFTRTKQMRRNLVATAHSIPNEVLLLTSTNAPSGALGPGDRNTIFDMHVWLQQYSGQGKFDQTGVTDGFTLNNNGTTFGADKLIGEALAVGVNYTYARSGVRADDGDRLDAESYWLGAYGEWVGVEGLYVDALAGYGYTSYDAERFAKDYHGLASYHGTAFGASVDVGQYYHYGDQLALSPYVGLHALSSSVGGHLEKDDYGGVMQVDEVGRDWVESALGLKMRHRFDTGIGRFQTTGYAEWTYDFVQDEVYSSMSSGNLAPVESAHVSPDESGINVGLGYSWICTDYMEIGVGYNGRFSDNYQEHSGSIMLDMMF